MNRIDYITYCPIVFKKEISDTLINMSLLNVEQDVLKLGLHHLLYQ